MLSRARRRFFSARPLSRLNKRHSPLLVRPLEDRTAPATFTVNVNTDTSGVAGGAGTGSIGDLRYCISQANLTPAADDIAFDATAFGSASTITIDPTLRAIGITADLTINGPTAKLTLSGNMASDILFSSGDTTTLATINVTVNNLTMDQGKILADSGNAFFANLTNLTMNNLTVSNTFGETNGGAVVVIDGSLKATNTSFTGNQLGNTSAAFVGGAVFVSGLTSTATFDSCTFSGNTATGAAGTSGGAFGTIGNTGAISFTKCLITSNSALANGGGVYIDLVSKVTFDQSTISLNVGQASGGGIFAGNGGDITISNSTVSGNTTPINGGGVYVGDDTATLTIGKITVTNSLFQGNKVAQSTAGRLGGGVCLVDAATGTFTDSTFDGNTAIGAPSIGCSGAAIGMFSTGDVTITRCAIQNNTAGNAAAFVGGNAAIFQNTGANLTIDQTSFTKNVSSSAGGAIFFNAVGKSFIVTNSTFEQNSTGNSGGALSSSATGTGTVILRNSTFFGNSAAGNGGAIRLFNAFACPVSIQNCTIVNNTAAGSGGGLAMGTTGVYQTTIDSTIIAQNFAGGTKTNAVADFFRNATTQTFVVNNSLVGNNGGTPIFTGSNNQIGTPTALLDPLLSSLANFGGLTKVMIPQAGSKAINNGSNPAGLTTDQRASATFKRDWDSSGKPDIGAAEKFIPAPVVVSVSAPIVTTVGGSSYQFTITFSDDQGINVSTLSAVGAVTVTGGKFGSPVDATFVSVDTNTNGTPRTATFQITPPGGIVDFGDNGNYKINIVANKIFDIDTPTAFAVPAGQVGGFTIGIGTTIIVNATNDEDVDTDTFTSFREAIILSNSGTHTGNDTIIFDATVFAAATTISMNAALGGITISDSVTINGPLATATLDAGFTGRHLKINGPGTLNVAITNMGFVNGVVTATAFGENGGAVNIADENVTFTNCVFDGNNAQLDGGALSVGGSGALVLNKCLFQNNTHNGTVLGSGGAVFYSGAGTMSISDSTFTMNTAFASAGAIWALNAASVTITNTTFTGNKSVGAGFVGGAVLLSNVASATINNCTFGNNEHAEFVTGGAGGALAVIGTTTVTINNSTFSNNTVGEGEGGAIWVRGDSTASVTINRCTFDGNQANGVTSLGGGAIYVGSSTIATAGTKLSIVESTLSNNSTTASGGAIAVENKGQLTITNSTLAFNTAGGDGGAVLLLNQAFANLIRNSTLAFNTANGATAGGGGIAITGTPTGGGALTLSSTIVSNNTATASAATDVGASALTNVAGDNNLVKANLVGSINYTGTNPQNGLDPSLDTTLKLNSAPAGSPLTLAITAVSAAHDKGNNVGTLTTDERGAGFLRVSGAGADIGAFEIQEGSPPAKLVSIQVNDGSIQRSMITSIKITFDSPVTFSGGAAAAFSLQNQKTSNFATLGAVVVGNVVTLTFTGGSVDLGGSLADGRYTLKILASGFAGGGFDGNINGVANGSPADDFTEVGAPSAGNNLFRLYGDGNADGTVNGLDFLAFRLAFLQPSATFDHNASGQVDGTDFLQFRLHFLQSV